MNGPDTRGSGRRWLTIALGLVVSAVFLWLAFRGTDLGEVWRVARGASVPVLCLVLLSKTGALIAASARSSVILRVLHPYGFGRVLKSLLVAFVGNAALPLRAGEVMRVAYLSRHSGGTVAPTSCVAVLVVERMMDTVFLLLLLAAVVGAGIVSRPDGVTFYVAAGLVVLGVLTVAVLVRRPAGAPSLFSRYQFISDKIDRFSHGLKALSKAGSLAWVAVATIGYWGFQALSIRIWFWAFNVTLPWYAPLVVLVFVAFGAALPSSPGFVGTYHFFAISAMMLLGIGRSEAASIATVGHFLAIVPMTLVGIVVLAHESLVRSDRSATPARAMAGKGGSPMPGPERRMSS